MICSDCAGKSLGIYISKKGTEGKCSFCGKRKTKIMSIDNVENFILRSWEFYYENANDNESAYEIFQPYEIEDLLENKDEIELEDTCEDFLEILSKDFAEMQWFPLGEGEIHGVDEMFYNWETFCETVKNKRRYIFLDYEMNTFPFVTSKSTLESIINLIESQKIVVKLDPKIPIYRGRVFSKLENTQDLKAADLGTPKSEFAKSSNRFSPEGIPLFYGCFDLGTVKLEINQKNSDILIIGEFHVLKEIAVIDFTSLPEIPSIYDEDNSMNRSGLEFLRKFSIAISEPVDTESKLDYIPTQVFTEFIREKFGKLIQGIKYRSSKIPDKDCVVLFYSNEECVDNDAIERIKNEDVLVLKNVIL